MCGIADIWRAKAVGQPSLEMEVQRMTDALTHCGFDGGGVWSGPQIGLAFGHRHLSVLELPAAGHQSMCSSCGQYVLNHNGEIYNHLDMLAQLCDADQLWRGHSDTEALLACIQAWG